MEQSGRNRWQPVANGTPAKAAQMGENRCRGLRPVAAGMHGKEGSTVRVRQRALQRRHPRKLGIFVVCHSTTEHFRITVGTAVEVAAYHEKWLQIGLLRGIAEHLLETAGGR
jgi:hypothetical protein